MCRGRSLAEICQAVNLMNAPCCNLCAGPLNFIFEKAKFNGVVATQLAEAQKQNAGEACLRKLFENLKSQESCKDINVYNQRYLLYCAKA